MKENHTSTREIISTEIFKVEKRSGCGHRSDSQKPGINHIYRLDSY